MTPENLGSSFFITPFKRIQTPDCFIGFCEADGTSAYILSDEKIPQEGDFTAVGIIEHRDGCTAVFVPERLCGTEICYECNIMHALCYVQEFINPNFYPKYEKTGGAVLYTEAEGERRYLLVKTKSGHIGFPKGHVEYGETEEQNALREVFEETGISARLRSDFRMEYTFTTFENSIKTGVFFLSHYENRKITAQESEIFSDWLLPYEKAYELLNFPQDREILKAAEQLLSGFAPN